MEGSVMTISVLVFTIMIGAASSLNCYSCSGTDSSACGSSSFDPDDFSVIDTDCTATLGGTFDRCAVTTAGGNIVRACMTNAVCDLGAAGVTCCSSDRCNAGSGSGGDSGGGDSGGDSDDDGLRCYTCAGSSSSGPCGSSVDPDHSSVSKSDCTGVLGSTFNRCSVTEASGTYSRSCNTKAICDAGGDTIKCCSSDLCNDGSAGTSARPAQLSYVVPLLAAVTVALRVSGLL